MHQYLFFIGDFPIRAYGAMLALAIICGASVAYFLLKKDGRGWHEHIIDFSITVAVAGLIGARLWDVFFFDWHYYGNHLLEIPFVWQGGMAIQGGVVLGTIAGYWYLRKNNIDFWAFADLFAPALILAQSVGRMANLLNIILWALLYAAGILVFSILKARWRIAPTAINHYGQPKSGKVKSTFLSL